MCRAHSPFDTWRIAGIGRNIVYLERLLGGATLMKGFGFGLRRGGTRCLGEDVGEDRFYFG